MRVRFERVTKRFGAHTAADGISLDVESGECLVLLGPSGCGKTTLLRLLAGLEPLDSGEIWIGDRRVDQLEPARRDVAMVFQNYALYPHLSVFDNIAFPLRTRHVETAEIDRRVREAATRVGLADLLARKPAQLSGGQQQRVALARAIVRNPTVYLMDEPLSNLDAQLRLQTRTELKRLHRELGTTMIYVTHDQGEAMTLGGRIAVMRGGRIVQIGRPLDLYRQPVDTFVGTFLGSPPMNLIAESRQGAVATIGVRAEDIVISPSPLAGGDEGRVLVVEPMGSETLLTLEYRSQRLVARVAADARFEPGQAVRVRLPDDRTLTFNADGTRIGTAGRQVHEP
ncbi:MAG: carbohydrate transporter ATP-binding protein family [Acidobacteria bacterium]|nr:carbohydrate transporter ATP-binding protein family [Acidobacteriota bacterium]